MTALQEALEEIAKAIPKVVWLPDLSEVEAKGRAIRFKAYTGKADGWEFLIVGMDLPELLGRRGYVVTATKLGLVMKLPSDLAEQAGKIAEAVRV